MRQELTRQEKRKAWLYAGLIVLGMILIAAVVWRLATLERPAEIIIPSAHASVLSASEDMDGITIDADFDPDTRQLTATQVMTLKNRTGMDQEQIVLRSYSGAYLLEDTSPAASDELFVSCYGDRFSTGGLLLDSAAVEGESVDYAWSDDARTVLTLPASWPAGATVRVTLTYHVHIPNCASRFGTADDIFALGNVFPTLAVWQDGAWRTDAYIAIGDPFQSECANWTMRLTVPEGYSVAATGYAEPVQQDGVSVYTMTAQATRDFALVISDRFVSAAGMAGDTLVVAYAVDSASAKTMLKYAQQAIACYEGHYGPYVYPTLTLAQVSFPFGGMEYPGMVMIGTSAMAAKDDTFEITVAHETAHQWWYAMVGSDSVNQAWQDESLCEYAVMDYIGQYYGQEARDSAAFQRIETALRITIPHGVTPGSPIDYFSDLAEYSQVVYRRGAALWMALETHMGKDTLDAALRRYQEEYRFRIATREELTKMLSDAAGHDVSALMTDYLDTYMN